MFRWHRVSELIWAYGKKLFKCYYHLKADMLGLHTDTTLHVFKENIFFITELYHIIKID